MVGSELPSPEHRDLDRDRGRPAVGRATWRCRAPDGRPLLDGITFRIHRGEVLGIAGVEGNGQAELVEAIMGMRPGATGTIVLGGQDLSPLSTRDRREAGIGYIPEDRHRHGLLLDAPLWENRILGHQTRPPSVQRGLIDRARRTRRHPADHRGATTSARPGPTYSPGRSPAATSRS